MVGAKEESPAIISDERIKQILEELLKKHKNREVEFKAECRAVLSSLEISDIRVCWGHGSGIADLYLSKGPTYSCIHACVSV
jgi:hypothetical protein